MKGRRCGTLGHRALSLGQDQLCCLADPPHLPDGPLPTLLLGQGELVTIPSTERHSKRGVAEQGHLAPGTLQAGDRL